MRRFWLDDENWQGDRLEITGELLHHIRDVCRFESGDRFELITAEGSAHLVEPIDSQKGVLVVKRLQSRKLPPVARPYVYLALSLPRYNKVDWIVEKCVELGVKGVVPFVSRYSFVRRTDEVSAAKWQRWEKLIRQATRQTGRGDVMELLPVANLKDLREAVNRKSQALSLVAYEQEDQTTLHQVLSQASKSGVEEIWIFIGSEGGFARDEVEEFKRNGVISVSLGSQVLRVETACLALASIIKYEFEGARHGSV